LFGSLLVWGCHMCRTLLPNKVSILLARVRGFVWLDCKT
jgi:hypothetical protein